MDAFPQEPDMWAIDTITQLKNASIIPEEFEGMYDAYITKENFYTLVMNVVESKLGKEELSNNFNLYMQEEYVSLDPVKGEIFMNDGMAVLDRSMLCSNKEVIYKAYQMGFLGHEGAGLEPDSYITRLEAAKMFAYIANSQGMDISDYEVINYTDIDDVQDSEKPFIYFAATKGILKGYGYNFNPNGYCTYQETYIMLMRLYNLL
ncbi:S-layer homology domain protein [anaerobic digester metagenome]